MILRSLFSSLDHNSIKTFRVILICNFHEIGIVVPFIGILLHLDEIESGSNISYFLSIPVKKEQFEQKVHIFF